MNTPKRKVFQAKGLVSLIFMFFLFILTDSAFGQLSISMSVGGTVNGQAVSAHGSGTGNTLTGEMSVAWNFDSVPSGYSVYASIVTTADPITASISEETEGASNLLTLSGGNYTTHKVAIFPGGDSVVSNVTVSKSGDTLTSNSVLSGNVTVPPLVGLSMQPAKWTPGPGGNQFIQEARVFLTRLDGGPSIPVDTRAIFTLASGSLSNVQYRVKMITVLNAQPSLSSPTSAQVLYKSTVRTSPEGVPSLTTYGLIALALLLPGTAVWMFRKRRVSVA